MAVTVAYEMELHAGVDASDTRQALILVALQLLNAAAEGEDGEHLRLDPHVPEGFIGHVDFHIGPIE